ncbi:TRAF3IP1 [Cordylochernes scorpioides]|uniref:TRAF3IP1 n=1 Tax=Cordylochernes scorpioides TaxID=51811 RepID=A0ABY6JZD6_9ARAC|nr:TRAF3IP1 [Cordylochernes scorpioides]
MAISEPKSAHLREVLLFAFNWKKSATEAHRMLEEVYSDHALSKSQCYRASARPASARLAPPKVKVRNRVESMEEESRMSSASKAVTNLILDTSAATMEADDNFVVTQEMAPQLPQFVVLASLKEALPAKTHVWSKTIVDFSPDLLGVVCSGSLLVCTVLTYGSASCCNCYGVAQEVAGGDVSAQELEELENEGLLMRQIMETKRLLEGSVAPQPRVDSATSGMGVAGLRELVQAVSRQAAPLGRLLEYLQEDSDSMVAELATWRSERQTAAEQLRMASQESEAHLAPLRAELMELEAALTDQQASLTVLRGTLQRNESHMARMLASLQPS